MDTVDGVSIRYLLVSSRNVAIENERQRLRYVRWTARLDLDSKHYMRFFRANIEINMNKAC